MNLNIHDRNNGIQEQTPSPMNDSLSIKNGQSSKQANILVLPEPACQQSRETNFQVKNVALQKFLSEFS